METKLTTGGGGSSDIPDYYLGMLIFYDEFAADNCKWVVFDGASKVRCPSRKEAIHYITTRHSQRTGLNLDQRLIDARIALQHAHQQLLEAAHEASALDQLLLERLAVRLRPVLVEIDNITIK